MSGRSETVSSINIWMLGILLLAVAVRVTYLIQYSHSAYWGQLTVDNWYHHHWAQSLADGHVLGDTTYFRAPLYVYCLGMLYAVFGESYWVGRLFGMAVGLLSIGTTYLLARRLIGRPGATLAALLHALLPIAIYFESELLLDTLLTLLLQIALLRFVIWLDTDRSRDLWLAGLALGLAAICRPTALIVAVSALGWAILKRPAQKSLWNTPWRLTRVMLLAAGLTICIGPVFLRNILVAGDPVPIASQGGINFYIGNNEKADGISAVLPEPLGHNWQIRQITYLAEKEMGRDLKPGEVSGFWQRKAYTWIWSHPKEFALLFARKFVYMISSREMPNERSLDTYFGSFFLLGNNPLVFGLIFPVALLGIVVLWRQQPGVRFLAVAMVMLILAMAFFFVNSRFRLPLMPLYCLLATGGLVWLWRTVPTRPLRTAGVLLVMVVIGWLSFHPPISYPGNLSTQSLTSRGLYLYSKGEYQESLRYFRQAADLQPDFPEVNLNLGAAYLRLGMPDSARTCFEREIARHPQRHKAYQNLAAMYLADGDYGHAVASADVSLSLAPYDILSNIVRLRALYRDSTVNDSKLLEETDEAARNTGNDISVLNEGGALLLTRGDAENALSVLLRAEMARPPAIETDDDAFGPGFTHGSSDFKRLRATTYFALGYCYSRLDRLPESVEYNQRAIASDSMMSRAYINLRAGYLSQGRLVEADSVLAEAKRRFPDDPLIRETIQNRP